MAWTRRYDEAEPQRVNRWLAQSGVCSRREAEGLIAQGLVSIDGEPVADAGRKIAPGQTLVLADAAEGELPQSSLTRPMLNKPVGVVSAQPEAGQVPAARLLTRAALVGESPASIPGSPRHPPGAAGAPRQGFAWALAAVGGRGAGQGGDRAGVRRSTRNIWSGWRGAVTEGQARPAAPWAFAGRPPAQAGEDRPGLERPAPALHPDGRAATSRVRRMCELVDLGVTDLLRPPHRPAEVRGLQEGPVAGAQSRRAGGASQELQKKPGSPPARGLSEILRADGGALAARRPP